MSRILVISPSGNFYGSEQVLLDYLKHTKQHFDVVLPVNSLFSEIIHKAITKHRIWYFNEKHLMKFYLQLFMKLLAGKYDTVYINEAGHSRYLLLLAKFFPAKRFVIHVRITEDTAVSRWKLFSAANTQLISISKNIEGKLPYPSILLYDLYSFSNKDHRPVALTDRTVLNIGIIGRITFSKGLRELGKFMDYIKKHQTESPYKFKMYGDIPVDLTNDPAIEKLKNNDTIEFMGFVESKKDIYNNIDIVLHLSKTEPLGRIFLEAIDEGKPLIGFKSAGIGEIGKLTGLEELLCDPLNENFPEEIFSKLEATRKNYPDYVAKIAPKKKIAATIFSPASYTEKLDNILLG